MFTHKRDRPHQWENRCRTQKKKCHCVSEVYNIVNRRPYHAGIRFWCPRCQNSYRGTMGATTRSLSLQSIIACQCSMARGRTRVWATRSGGVWRGQRRPLAVSACQWVASAAGAVARNRGDRDEVGAWWWSSVAEVRTWTLENRTKVQSKVQMCCWTEP